MMPISKVKIKKESSILNIFKSQKKPRLRTCIYLKRKDSLATSTKKITTIKQMSSLRTKLAVEQ